MPDTSDQDVVAVTLYNDRRGEESQIQVAPALAALLAWAHAWTLQTSRGDDATLSFSSMLAALVSGQHPLCAWLREHLALRGVSAEVVARGIVVTDAALPARHVVTSYSFRQALAEAQALARGRLLDVRHVMAAYVVVRDYHREDFLRLRIDRRAWCLALADTLILMYPDEAAEWAEFGRRAPAVLLPGFSADLPGGADLLGIGREVEAFAMLVAGRDTSTPLSIGVFGAWGTGKSFFMRRLEVRVAGLRTEGPASAYFHRIAQVRFNAWHYSETNIIASLVDEIFRNLRFEPDEEEATLLERRQRVLTQMTAADEARGRAERELESASTTEQTLRANVERVRREAEAEAQRTQADLASTVQAIGEAQQALQESAGAQSDAAAAAARRAPAAEAAAFVSRTILEDEQIARLGRDLAQARDDVRWIGLNQTNILWGVAVIVVTLLVTFTVASLKETKLIAGLLGLAAAFGPVARTWLTTLRAVAARGAELQDAVRARAEAVVRKVEADFAQEREGIEAELARRQDAATQLRAQLQELQTRTTRAAEALAQGETARRAAAHSLAAATAEVTVKRAQLAAVTSGSLLQEAITGLATKDDYRKELGTIARVRTDFERLSRRMRKARIEFEKGESKEAPVLDRLVLYIDDLDRCAPDKVRAVLHAVHLLLAFDLFVCVVAVDPRWVIQCLEESPGLEVRVKNAELETLGGVATASDYLEKIFQIPLWLRPVRGGQRAPIAASMLRMAPQDTSGSAHGQREGSRFAGASGQPGVDERVAEPTLARAPAPITIVPSELQFLDKVSPLLDGNVRALKRFVNTYRLVKASLSDVELDYFTKAPRVDPNTGKATGPNRSPYMVCLAQLAVLATQRARAQLLVKQADQTQDNPSLATWIANLSTGSGLAPQLAKDLEAVLLPELKDVKFSDFAVWLERTRRYSFYL